MAVEVVLKMTADEIVVLDGLSDFFGVSKEGAVKLALTFLSAVAMAIADREVKIVKIMDEGGKGG